MRLSHCIIRESGQCFEVRGTERFCQCFEVRCTDLLCRLGKGLHAHTPTALTGSLANALRAEIPTCSAGLARDSIRTNHCSRTRGSTISPPLWDRGTRIVYGSSLMTRPASYSIRQGVSSQTSFCRAVPVRAACGALWTSPMHTLLWPSQLPSSTRCPRLIIHWP